MKLSAMHRILGIALVALPTFPASAWGQSTTTTSTDATMMELIDPRIRKEAPQMETITILGRKTEVTRISGSAHRIGIETLTDFEYDDILRVLSKIPGVYVRDEDGFGLRPNIGLRGANSDRSSRIVLMEDGILLGPAPYSAPAAYYTPLTTRMVGIEVFKGPSSIQFGPYTTGGAINYQTAEVPFGHAGMVDAAVGQFNYGKLHGRYGWGGRHFGFLVEGVRLDTSGFKQVDGDPNGDTGFTKNELMVKARLNSNPSGRFYHRLDVKVGYSDELSNETYLGLTDDDFRADPFRRYRGSQLDRMEWTRTQAQASYTFTWGDNQTVKLTAYRNDFTRAWRKVNNFRTLSGGTETRVDDVLTNTAADPNYPLLLRMVRGEASSADIFSADTTPSFIGIGTNDRTFVSQGLQLDGVFHWDFYEIEQEIRLGARLHYDEIQRRHDEAPFEMVLLDGQASVVQAGPIRPTTVNDESALAISLYAQNEITLFEDFIITPGVRAEIIDTNSDQVTNPAATPEQQEMVNVTRDDVVIIPGIGAYAQVLDWVGILAGLHRGFSPVQPGQVAGVEPETSLNYEFGARFGDNDRRRLEVIGFYSDYSNLLLNCTVSGGCNLTDVQFNAGDVELYGLEASGHVEHRFGRALEVTVDASYTWTGSSINNTFQSTSLQFEEVETGDELPYVPRHQASVTVGLTTPILGTSTGVRLSYTFVDSLLNEAGRFEDATGGDLTDVQHLLDATLLIDFADQYRLYARADNILNQEYITARRPFGARPGKPFQLVVGFRFDFGD